MNAFDICLKINKLQNEIDELLVNLIDSDFIVEYFSENLNEPDDVEFNFETSFCSCVEKSGALYNENEKLPVKKYKAKDGTVFYATHSDDIINAKGFFYIPINNACVEIFWYKIA